MSKRLFLVAVCLIFCASTATLAQVHDIEEVYLLIDVDANQKLFDKLVEEYPSVASLLLLSSVQAGLRMEDGTVNAFDQRHLRAHNSRIPSSEVVRRVLAGEQFDTAEAALLNDPLPIGANALYQESFYTKLPGDRIEMTVRASAIYQTSMEAYDVIDIVAEVHLVLELLEEDAYEVARYPDEPPRYASVYRLVDMTDTTP